jgi:phage-related tail protein
VAVKDPRFVEPLNKAGVFIQYLNAADFQAFMTQQDELNGKMLKVAGLAASPD